MTPQELSAQIAQAHADIEVRLTELRTQKDAINAEIKSLMQQQQDLPVSRVKRAPRQKKNGVATVQA
jgi:hypothetical protein